MTTESQKPTFSLRVRSALFEIATNEPEHAPRWIPWAVALLIGILVIWACFAKPDIVAVAEGRLVPQTYVKIVQPTEAGIVREILVDEGDEVAAGQVLQARTLRGSRNEAAIYFLGRRLLAIGITVKLFLWSLLHRRLH